jgi:hypothetical protein
VALWESILSTDASCWQNVPYAEEHPPIQAAMKSAGISHLKADIDSPRYTCVATAGYGHNASVSHIALAISKLMLMVFSIVNASSYACISRGDTHVLYTSLGKRLPAYRLNPHERVQRMLNRCTQIERLQRNHFSEGLCVHMRRPVSY